MNASSIEVFILLFLVIPPKLLKVPAMHRLLYKQTNKKLSLAPFSFCLIVNFFFASNKRLQCCDSPRHSSWQLLMKTDISCLNHIETFYPISSQSCLISCLQTDSFIGEFPYNDINRCIIEEINYL